MQVRGEEGWGGGGGGGGGINYNNLCLSMI